MQVFGNRFGNEDVVDHVDGSLIPTPDYDILLGGVAGSSALSPAAQQIMFNHFQSKETPLLDGALSAIKLTDRPNLLQINNNFFAANWSNSFLDDSYAGVAINSLFKDNMVAASNGTPIFNSGATPAGWTVVT